jgi:hypothetical protein
MHTRWILVIGLMVGCVSATPLEVGPAGGAERAGDDPLERCEVEVALEENEQTYDVGPRGGLYYRTDLRVDGLPEVPHNVGLTATLESGDVRVTPSGPVTSIGTTTPSSQCRSGTGPSACSQIPA